MSATSKSGNRFCVRSRDKENDAGYTLLELLVAIAVIGLIAALAVPSVGSTLTGTGLAADARGVATELRRLQSDAATTQTTITVAPDALLVSADTQATIDGDPIVFYADGTTTGGRVVLARGSRRVTVTLAWLTGRVTVGETP